MKVYKYERIDTEKCVLALGSFDTIHIGHKQLILRAKDYASELGIPMGVYMFEKRPAHLLERAPQKDTYTAPQRERLIEALGVGFIYYEKFDTDFMQKSPEEFVRYLKDKLSVKAVFVGFNYRFGKNAAGDSVLLCALGARYGIEVIVVPAVCDAEGVVSSTRVRKLLAEGDLSANVLLGRPFELEGYVEKDRGVGHAMGVPTANLVLPENVLLPKDGVYMTVAIVDGACYPSVTNIGIRPTFGLEKRTVETHLLDYAGDLYGKTIRLAFYTYLREERVFADVDGLVAQISEDKQRAKELFLKINSEKS